MCLVSLFRDRIVGSGFQRTFILEFSKDSIQPTNNYGYFNKIIQLMYSTFSNNGFTLHSCHTFATIIQMPFWDLNPIEDSEIR